MSFDIKQWVAFGLIFGLFFALDLVLHRRGHETQRRAILWAVLWISAGLGFWVFVWVVDGTDSANKYLTAYLIEESLSLDNLFVFLLIFKSLNLSVGHQRVALTWGVFGALVSRGAFVFAGASALRRWTWLEYVFAAILFIAAWRALRGMPESEGGQSRIVEFFSKRLPVSRNVFDTRFLVRENNRRKVTVLLLAIIAVELTDIVFAVDSVPAALSVTRQEFLVYSSNAFAVLGLRSIYVVVATTIARLRYLHYGVSGILAFAGMKIALGDLMDIPPLLSAGIVVALVALPSWLSVRTSRPEEGHPERS